MADLIDRQKIKAKFESWLKVKGYSEGELNMLKAVIYEITIMPSEQQCEYWDSESNYCALYRPSAQPIDAVKVVQCNDCKHYQFADNRAFGFPVKRCELTGFEDVDDDDFCSRGERNDVRRI